MRSLGIAVWGIGPHALNRVLPAIAEVDRLRLIGVCSRSAANVAEAQGRFGGDGWTDAREMLRDDRVDVVFLSTPTGVHAQHGRQVLEAGKHLWCEKPATTSAADTAALVELSRARGLAIAEAFMYLHHPHFAALKALLRGGRLGRIHSVSIRFGIPPLQRQSFRTDPDLGGSAFLDVGSYCVSAAAALFPEQQPTVSFTEMNTAAGSRVDTSGRALLGYGDGLTVALEWCIDCAYRNEVDAWGTAGSMRTDRIFSKPADVTPRITVFDQNGAMTFEDGPPANHFSLMLNAFAELVDDAEAAERERQAITRRAQLAARIKESSRL